MLRKCTEHVKNGGWSSLMTVSEGIHKVMSEWKGAERSAEKNMKVNLARRHTRTFALKAPED